MATKGFNPKTKKEFREFLNCKYGMSVDKRGSLRGAKVRMYGDWLYSADKEVFDMTYLQWLKTGSDEGL